MKCQNCGKLEANFHYSSNINGNVTECHLCSACADELGYSTRPFFKMEPEIGRLFDRFWPAFGINMPRLVSSRPQMGILERQSVAVDEDMKKRRELNVLREEMRSAAEREDFERAIELREELRKYEGYGG